MENAQKAIMIGVGLFIMIIILSGIILLANTGADFAGSASDKMDSISASLETQIIEQYDKKIMSGAQVRNAFMEYASDSKLSLILVSKVGGAAENTDNIITYEGLEADGTIKKVYNKQIVLGTGSRAIISITGKVGEDIKVTNISSSKEKENILDFGSQNSEGKRAYRKSSLSEWTDKLKEELYIDTKESYMSSVIRDSDDVAVGIVFEKIEDADVLISIETKPYTLYGTVPIPNGFYRVEGEINDDLVIQDSSGNQFVWVPVNNISDFKQISYIEHDDDTLDTAYPGATILRYKDPVNSALKTSVETYKGFYIARYEAGNESGNVVSKKDVKPYNNVTYNQALYLANSMYSGNEYVNSHLIYGIEWDAALKFIGGNYGDETTGVYKGHYTNLAILKAGPELTGQYRFKNIYDMAGNIEEITQEQYLPNSNQVVIRGGSYVDKYDWGYIPAGHRHPYDKGGAYLDYGFRVALYIK